MPATVFLSESITTLNDLLPIDSVKVPVPTTSVCPLAKGWEPSRAASATCSTSTS